MLDYNLIKITKCQRKTKEDQRRQPLKLRKTKLMSHSLLRKLKRILQLQGRTSRTRLSLLSRKMSLLPRRRKRKALQLRNQVKMKTQSQHQRRLLNQPKLKKTKLRNSLHRKRFKPNKLV